MSFNFSGRSWMFFSDGGTFLQFFSPKSLIQALEPSEIEKTAWAAPGTVLLTYKTLGLNMKRRAWNSGVSSVHGVLLLHLCWKNPKKCLQTDDPKRLSHLWTYILSDWASFFLNQFADLLKLSKFSSIEVQMRLKQSNIMEDPTSVWDKFDCARVYQWWKWKPPTEIAKPLRNWIGFYWFILGDFTEVLLNNPQAKRAHETDGRDDVELLKTPVSAVVSISIQLNYFQTCATQI